MNYKIDQIFFFTCLLLFLGACMAGTKHEHPGRTSGNNQPGNRKLVNIAAENLHSIEWIDKSGRNEVIQKEDHQWYYAGMEQVDSSAFNQYINALMDVNGTELSVYRSTQDLDMLQQITLYGNTMNAPIVITAYKNVDDEKPFLIHSSALAEYIFISDSAGIYRYIFKDLRQFWPNGQ